MISVHRACVCACVRFLMVYPSEWSIVINSASSYLLLVTGMFSFIYLSVRVCACMLRGTGELDHLPVVVSCLMSDSVCLSFCLSTCAWVAGLPHKTTHQHANFNSTIFLFYSFAKVAKYQSIFSDKHPVILMFWEVFFEFDAATQQKFFRKVLSLISTSLFTVLVCADKCLCLLDRHGSCQHLSSCVFRFLCVPIRRRLEMVNTAMDVMYCCWNAVTSMGLPASMPITTSWV